MRFIQLISLFFFVWVISLIGFCADRTDLSATSSHPYYVLEFKKKVIEEISTKTN